MGEQTLLTIPEAAKVLRVAVSTLRAWKLQGKFLTFRKIGGRILVHRDDIARFIEAGKIAPAKGGCPWITHQLTTLLGGARKA
jgi:excisionase family DNA binding protein